MQTQNVFISIEKKTVHEIFHSATHKANSSQTFLCSPFALDVNWQSICLWFTNREPRTNFVWCSSTLSAVKHSFNNPFHICLYVQKNIFILISNHRRHVKPEDDDNDVTEASSPAPPTELATQAPETTLIPITTLPQTTELITSTDPSTTTSRVVDATVAMDKVEPRALN